MMVKVNMRGTVYYAERPGQPKQRYGPGQGIEVPERLALALGLTPLIDAEPAPVADSRPWGDLKASTIELLEAAGYTAETVHAADDDALLSVEGIGPATLAIIRRAGKE